MALSGGAWAQIHSKPPFPYRLPLRRIGPKQDAVHLEGAVPVTAGVVCEASDACEDITDRGLLTYEYALEIEKILQDGGHAKTVSDRGYAAGVVCEASDACEDITDRGLLTYEYALEIEKILQDGGHAKTVSDRGYALSVAGTRVTKTQRLSGKVPKEAVVVSNVRLGGGLAADYHNLAQEVMEGIVERLAPQPAAASSAKDANGN